MDAQMIKEQVREYCNSHHPGWKCASVTVRVGEVLDGTEEVLLVLPVNGSVSPNYPPLGGALNPPVADGDTRG